MFRIYWRGETGATGLCHKNPATTVLAEFQTAQEAIDEATARSGKQLKAAYIVVEEIASVVSQPTVPPIETKITPIKEGFRPLS